MSIDHPAYLLWFPLFIHCKYSYNERFMPSTNSVIHGAFEVRGLRLLL